MTNNEVISNLKAMLNEEVLDMPKCEQSIFLCEKALEENTRLKAEIEQLKNEFETYYKLYLASIDARKILTECVEKLKEEVIANKNWSDVVERTLKKEIDKNEMLKSELEQSVKLPCNVGDDIYFRVKGRNQFAEYVDFIQTQKITRIDIDEDRILYCSATENFIECDINNTIFLTREEAEQSLKGQVEE